MTEASESSAVSTSSLSSVGSVWREAVGMPPEGVSATGAATVSENPTARRADGGVVSGPLARDVRSWLRDVGTRLPPRQEPAQAPTRSRLVYWEPVSRGVSGRPPQVVSATGTLPVSHDPTAWSADISIVSGAVAGGVRSMSRGVSSPPSRRYSVQQRHVSLGAARSRLLYAPEGRRQMDLINALGLEPSVRK